MSQSAGAALHRLGPPTDVNLHVLLIDSYAPDGQGSMQRFVRVLAERLPDWSVRAEILRPAVVWGQAADPHSGLGQWLGYVDKLLVFPRTLRRALRRCRNSTEPLVVHVCGQANALYTSHLADVPHLVTCHDVLAIGAALGEYPEHCPRWSDCRLQARIRRGLTRAQRITCASWATLQDVRRVVGGDPGRADVTEMGLHYPFAPMPADEARGRIAVVVAGRSIRLPPGAPFLLHVGGNQWHKNRLGLLQLYARLVERSRTVPALVMVGRPFTLEMQQFVEQHMLRNRVIPICDCPDAALRAFYAQAELLVFPSWREGFGWPLAEAQACGCRVATTNRVPMTSVAGSAGIYFDPADLDGAAAVVHAALLEDAPARRERIQMGLDNAARFSTGKMVQRYVGIYHDLAAADPAPARITEACAA